MRSFRRSFAALLAILTSALVFAAAALAATDISVTFVRHAESQANADGIIDTQVPGPDITALGQQQAIAIAAALAANGYDGIYASDMVRTQETAAPLAAILDQPVTILAGLHEIGAGIYEGSSEDSGLGRLGYALTPLAWILGARGVPMLGSTDPDGNAFEARVNDAIQTIYDSGNTNAVVFSHGATIMFWTMMNVDNPDLSLLLTHQLGNTGVVVIEGNPEDGWTLVSWDGVAVDPEPSFVTKLFVDVRDLVTTPQAAAYAVMQALSTGDLAAAADAFVKGAIAVAWAPIKFAGAVISDVIDLVHDVLTPAQTDTESVDGIQDTEDGGQAVAPSTDTDVQALSAQSDLTVQPAGETVGAAVEDTPAPADPVPASEAAESSESATTTTAPEAPDSTMEDAGQSDTVGETDEPDTVGETDEPDTVGETDEPVTLSGDTDEPDTVGETDEPDTESTSADETDADRASTTEATEATDTTADSEAEDHSARAAATAGTDASASGDSSQQQNAA